MKASFFLRSCPLHYYINSLFKVVFNSHLGQVSHRTWQDTAGYAKVMDRLTHRPTDQPTDRPRCNSNSSQHYLGFSENQTWTG